MTTLRYRTPVAGRRGKGEALADYPVHLEDRFLSVMAELAVRYGHPVELALGVGASASC
jgi:hypothetical protein